MKIFRWIILIVLLLLVISLSIIQFKSCKANAATIPNEFGKYNFDRIEPYLLDYMNGNSNVVGLEYYFDEQISNFSLAYNLELFNTNGEEILISPTDYNKWNVYINLYTSLKDENGKYYLALIDTKEIDYSLEGATQNKRIVVHFDDCYNYNLSDKLYGWHENSIPRNVLNINEINPTLKTPYTIGENFKFTTQIKFKYDIPVIFDFVVKEYENNLLDVKNYFYSYTCSFDAQERIGASFARANANATPITTSMQFLQAEKEIIVSVERVRYIREADLNATGLYWTNKTEGFSSIVINTPTPLYYTNYTVPVAYGSAEFYDAGDSAQITTPIFEPPIFTAAITITPLDDISGLDISNQLYDIFTNTSTYQSFIISMPQDYITITGNTTPHRVGQAYTGSQLNLSTQMYIGYTWFSPVDELVSLPGTTSQELTNAYNRGYDSGKRIGYNEGREAGEQTVNPETVNYISGYTTGFYEGLAQAGGDENTLGSYGFISTLLQILNIDIIPGFSIGTILTIIAAFALLTLVIKLTRGG